MIMVASSLGTRTSVPASTPDDSTPDYTSNLCDSRLCTFRAQYVYCFDATVLFCSIIVEAIYPAGILKPREGRGA